MTLSGLRHALLSSLLVSAGACGGGEPAPAPPVVRAEPSASAGGTTRLARLPDSREGDAAALVGTLRAEDGCLYVAAGDGTRFLIGSMIPGARWDETEEVLVIPAAEGPAETRFAPGDRILLGGSEARPGVLDDLWVDPPGDGCDAGRVWVTSGVTRVPD
jgi:hypothetical protein